ncbi:MAG: hypothetical protein IPN76_25990, partial [Saprospiraceae bacterium]|nr:hypothetical protein [Saprospiraceae bacterium]
MKIINLIFPIFLLAFIVGCEKEEIEPKVDENGLTREITDLVPQSTLDEMKRLGMPINGGANPPLLENTYYASPFILLSSNRPGDVPGFEFADYSVTFHHQNNQALTVMVDYENGPESGEGVGSYIVGDDCSFSVFVEINAVHSFGGAARLIHVISGTLANDGIEALYFANFMIDNNGNPSGIWIEEGEGRVVYDQDGFSELTGTDKTWYSSLPPCPCTYQEAQKLGKTNCPKGEWLDCGSGDLIRKYHYGAAFEVRWAPEGVDVPGQQCTYNSNGALITAGIAAGSPDMDSPDGCGFPSGIDLGHYSKDVLPWESGLVSVPCWQYLRDWPANNRNDCAPENRVTDIQHMLSLVGDMPCEAVTELFVIIDNTSNVAPDLKKFVHGGLDYTPSNLLEM